MPENKKHHYVPRFYLKRFSSNSKSINLWNISSEKKVLAANLKNQCYRDYFYGEEPGPEKALGTIEGQAAEIFRRIESSGCPPPPKSVDHLNLIMYIAVQHLRTKQSVSKLQDMTDKMTQEAFGPVAEQDGVDLTKIKIGFSEPGLLAVQTALEGYPLLIDLAYKLIINHTASEFITSDNPVVTYNQLFRRENVTGNSGFGSKGLLVFLPLSPRYCLVLYDYDIYRIGKAREWSVDVTDERDIHEVNTLQTCNAEDNIYFSDDAFNIEALIRKSAPFRNDASVKVHTFPGEKDGKRQSKYIVTTLPEIKTNFSVSFISTKKGAKKWYEKFRRGRLRPAAVPRNKELSNDYQEFRELKKAGKYGPMDFFRFIHDKYPEDCTP